MVFSFLLPAFVPPEMLTSCAIMNLVPLQGMIDVDGYSMYDLTVKCTCTHVYVQGAKYKVQVGNLKSRRILFLGLYYNFLHP